MRSPVLPPAVVAALGGVIPAPKSCPAGWPGIHVPNFDEWQRGDIVLVERDKTLAGSAILAGQSLSFNRYMVAGRRWSHAAIYVGSGEVVDATYGNPVQRRSVWGYCHHRAITVRRLDDPAVSPSEVVDIADQALSFVGQPYSAVGVAVAKLFPGQQPQRRYLFCSSLVGLAVSAATGVYLANLRSCRPLYPGVLASHPLLQQVQLAWHHI